MVRLVRQTTHDQKRPRRQAAPTSLQDPLLQRNFWHQLYHERQDPQPSEADEYADGDVESEDDNENEIDKEPDEEWDMNLNDDHQDLDNEEDFDSKPEREELEELEAIGPVIRIRNTRKRPERERERGRRTRPALSEQRQQQPGMVVFKMAPERLRRIKKGLRWRTSASKQSSEELASQEVNVEEVIEEIEDSDEEPYRGVITGDDADTSRTLPLEIDEKRFETALRNVASQRRVSPPHQQQPVTAASHQNVSKIRMIHIGGYEIDTWYTAPYPEEYSKHSVLPLCEFCLKYLSSDYVAWRHRLKCQYKHPPGDEIYRHGTNSVFEVDGKKMPLYCQNLCLLAKMFLDSKTLYYDVEPFMFYVLTENDKYGCHFVGYFSKQKIADKTANKNAYNVSCILTLPTAQRKGYGNFLIDFSYLLTRRQNTTGTPEKPLSSLGLASYTNYWKLAICQQLQSHMHDDKLSIAKLSQATGMTLDDVVFGLEQLRFLAYDPVSHKYALRIDKQIVNDVVERWNAKNYIKLHHDKLLWVPLIGSDNAPPLQEQQDNDNDNDVDIDSEDPDEVRDRLEVLFPPDDTFFVPGVANNVPQTPAIKKTPVLKWPSQNNRSASSQKKRAPIPTNPDGTPVRTRGRPKGAIAVKNLAKNLGVTIAEAEAIRKRDRQRFLQHDIQEYPDYATNPNETPAANGNGNGSSANGTA